MKRAITDVRNEKWSTDSHDLMKLVKEHNIAMPYIGNFVPVSIEDMNSVKNIAPWAHGVLMLYIDQYTKKPYLRIYKSGKDKCVDMALDDFKEDMILVIQRFIDDYDKQKRKSSPSLLKRFFMGSKERESWKKEQEIQHQLEVEYEESKKLINALKDMYIDSITYSPVTKQAYIHSSKINSNNIEDLLLNSVSLSDEVIDGIYINAPV